MSEVREQMITRPEELTACCEAIAACSVFGFDTEFVGEDSYHPRLCLVQVATPDCLYLIDPVTVGPLDAFWQLVVDPARVVVVHAGREEVRLCRLWTGHAPGTLFDLQLGAGLCGLTYPLGHGPLVQQVLGVQLAKGETLTEWRDRPLTQAQIRYAYDDVRYLLALWGKLSENLERRGRASWAREEFARLAASTDPEEESSQERWRKLRGLGSLDRRRLAIVKHLHAWREQRAAENNRPSRVILRDDLIVEIARRNPTRSRDLQVVRGLPRRDLDAIVEVVQLARDLPAEQCPDPIGRDQEPPRAELVRAILGAVLADHCARLGLAPNLVASNQDLKGLVRARMTGAPLPDDSQLTRGWRAQHLLPVLLAILDGQRLIRVANLQAEAPLDYADREDPKTPA